MKLSAIFFLSSFLPIMAGQIGLEISISPEIEDKSLPAGLQALAPKIPMFQLKVAQEQQDQEGICAYHAAANAKAVKDCIADGDIPTSSLVRQRSEKYACDMKSIYDCQGDFAMSIKLFEGLCESPYDLKFYKKTNDVSDALFNHYESADGRELKVWDLHKVITDRIQQMTETGVGAFVAPCALTSEDSFKSHVVVCALVKPQCASWRLLYMDSKNQSLNGSDNAYKQVAEIIKKITRPLAYDL